MKNVMTTLLMVVTLGVVFIQSSEALKCHATVGGTCDAGDICLKVTNAGGIRLLFYLQCAIKLS